jgi:putative spermidine/putrescine transport system permease protein
MTATTARIGSSAARRWAPWALLTPNLLWLALLMAGPLVLLGIISLHRYQSGRGIIETYDLDNYTRFIGDPFYREVLWNTLLLGAYVSLLSLVLAFPIAYALSRSRGLARTLLYFCVLLPLLTSAVVRTFGWMILLGNNGFINRMLISLGLTDDPVRLMYSMPGVVVALTEVLMPFMVLALDAALLNIAPQIYEAARNLGAGRARIFFRITLPLSMPGVVSGIVLVFTLAISAFVTPNLIGGPKIKVMPTMIYQQALFLLNWPFGAAIAFVMLFAMLALLVAAMKLTDRRTGS